MTANLSTNSTVSPVAKYVRLPLLALTLGGVMLVLGRLLLLSPTTGQIKSSFTFPEQVPLPGWQAQSATALPVPEKAQNEMVSGKSYRYVQGNRPLTVEIRYLVNTDPSVRNLLLKYGKPTPTVAFPTTIQQDEAGSFYSIYADETHAHLTSCINPRGSSTVTEAQFMQNRYALDLRPERALPVLLGRETLRDGRCLWTVMSAPLQGSSATQVYPQLKAAWADWQAWWQPRFPTP
ncbi:MAG: hypothetical protein OHK0037_37320 [Elainellaceae cyanobacterium]